MNNKNKIILSVFFWLITYFIRHSETSTPHTPHKSNRSFVLFNLIQNLQKKKITQKLLMKRRIQQN